MKIKYIIYKRLSQVLLVPRPFWVYKATLSLLLTIHVVLFDLLFLLSAFILAFSCLFMVLVLSFQLLYHCRSVYKATFSLPFTIHVTFFFHLFGFLQFFSGFYFSLNFLFMPSLPSFFLLLLYAIKVYITQLHKTSC